MRRIQLLFKKSESEDTWEAFTLALKNISVWVQQDNATQYEGFVDHFKLLQQSIIKTVTRVIFYYQEAHVWSLTLGNIDDDGTLKTVWHSYRSIENFIQCHATRL